MRTSLTNRGAILERVHAATADSPAGERSQKYELIPRTFRQKGVLPVHAKVQLLIERLHEYGVETLTCEPHSLVPAIGEKLAASGAHLFSAPPGIRPEWRIPDVQWTADARTADGVLTAASCAIADSGTIVLHHTPEEGNRTLTLLPDWHVCVLFASQIVETLPEYFSRFHKPPSLITWISGPSATADIEMTRIKGVHGPRNLTVVLVHEEQA